MTHSMTIKKCDTLHNDTRIGSWYVYSMMSVTIEQLMPSVVMPSVVMVIVTAL